MTKIVAISDTHTLHGQFKIPECDLLIHCGDFTSMGKHHEIVSFKNWLMALLDNDVVKEIVVVPGNHDLMFERDPRFARNLMADPQIHVLIDQSVELFGLKIYGSPYTPTFFDWAFMEDEDKLIERWKRIPDDAQIVITHGPPFGHLDSISHGKVPRGGSQTLLERIEQVRPLYHCFGHLHNDGGRIKESYYGEDGTEIVTYVNAAALDDNYRPRKNVPVVFEVP